MRSADARGGRACSSALLGERRLSARGLQRLRRVALTIADLADQAPPLTLDHVAAANALRTEPVGVTARLAV